MTTGDKTQELHQLLADQRKIRKRIAKLQAELGEGEPNRERSTAAKFWDWLRNALARDLVIVSFC